MLFFSYFTLHGSMPNYSNQTRKSVLVQMHAGDDEIEDENRHTNVQLVLRVGIIWQPGLLLVELDNKEN